MTKLRSVLIGVFCLSIVLSSSVAEGRVSRICKVSYETSDGWSKDYKLEVEFVTGEELNRSTRSFKYSMLSNYALVWFDKDEVAILKLEELLLVTGREFKNDDFKLLFTFHEAAKFLQVNSEEERVWRIKGRELLTFIDPRADR